GFERLLRHRLGADVAVQSARDQVLEAGRIDELVDAAEAAELRVVARRDRPLEIAAQPRLELRLARERDLALRLDRRPGRRIVDEGLQERRERLRREVARALHELA